MGVPNAVKKQAAEAENLAQQIMRQNAEHQDDGPDVEALIAESNKDDEPQSGPDPTPPDTDSPEQERDTQDLEAKFRQATQDLDALRQQHSTLLGKYNREVPRLNEENRSLKEQVNVKDESIKLLEDQLKAAQEAPPEPPGEDVDTLKKRLMQEYNEDLVDGVVSLAQNVARNSRPDVDTTQYETRLEALQKRVDELDATKVDDKLDMMIPNWRSIEASPEFQNLLGSRVPRTNNLIYDNLLKQWYQHGDVASIVQFFNEFLNEQQQPPKRTAEEVAVEPDSGSGDPPPPAKPRGKKVWKVSEIEKINQMERDGYFKKRKDELAKLRRDYEIAASEGRVVKDM